MKTNHKRKLQLQDITNYESSNSRIFTCSRSPTPKSIGNKYSKYSSSNYRSVSPSPSRCCDHNRGIMRQAIAQRIQEYKRDYKKKLMRKTIENVAQNIKEREDGEITDYPQINAQSKKIYERVAEKRNLSPKVLVRFQQYQHSKNLNKIKQKVYAYYKKNKKVPKPQQIISSENLGEMQSAKRMIDQLQNSLQKFVTKKILK